MKLIDSVFTAVFSFRVSAVDPEIWTGSLSGER